MEFSCGACYKNGFMVNWKRAQTAHLTPTGSTRDLSAHGSLNCGFGAASGIHKGGLRHDSENINGDFNLGFYEDE